MELTEKQAARDPIHHFESWRQHAYEVGELQPDAMALATVGKNGRPSVRFVMLRGGGRSGPCLLHELREPEGRGVGRESLGQPGLLLAEVGAAGQG